MSAGEDRAAPHRIAVGGVDVTYRRAGSGPPAVYFHGMGLTRRWLPLYDRLAETFDLTVPDHPGFGDTARPRWFRTLDDLVLHQADVLDALRLPTIHLIGHSLGGLIAGSFAALFPERVRSLTLVAPAPLPVGSPAPTEPAPDADIDQLLFNGHKDAYPGFLAADDAGTLVAADDGSDAFADPGAWDPSGAPGLYRRLARARMPRQVLVPDEDLLFPPATFDAWTTALGGARVVPIRGRARPTGHLLVVQEPEQIAAAATALAGQTA